MIFTFQYGSTLIIRDSHSALHSFRFTFQYGSTLMREILFKAKRIDNFTFQYGSTLILAEIFMKSWIVTLHSNMVLL